MSSEPQLKQTLLSRLKAADKVAILALGSELRSDDAAGILTGREIQKLCPGNRYGRKIKVYFGETAPENFTGEIKRFQPSHVFIIDAAQSGLPPGTISEIDPDDIDGISFSTHSLPIKVTAEYLKASIGCKIVIIGIEPKNLTFGSPITDEIANSSKKAARIIFECLARIFPIKKKAKKPVL